jgi:hypothetical protein
MNPVQFSESLQSLEKVRVPPNASQILLYPSFKKVTAASAVGGGALMPPSLNPLKKLIMDSPQEDLEKNLPSDSSSSSLADNTSDQTRK